MWARPFCPAPGFRLPQRPPIGPRRPSGRPDHLQLQIRKSSLPQAPPHSDQSSQVLARMNSADEEEGGRSRLSFFSGSKHFPRRFVRGFHPIRRNSPPFHDLIAAKFRDRDDFPGPFRRPSDQPPVKPGFTRSKPFGVHLKGNIMHGQNIGPLFPRPHPIHPVIQIGLHFLPRPRQFPHVSSPKTARADLLALERISACLAENGRQLHPVRPGFPPPLQQTPQIGLIPRFATANRRRIQGHPYFLGHAHFPQNVPPKSQSSIPNPLSRPAQS